MIVEYTEKRDQKGPIKNSHGWFQGTHKLDQTDCDLCGGVFREREIERRKRKGLDESVVRSSVNLYKEKIVTFWILGKLQSFYISLYVFLK